jgi:hypothetical protein
VQGTLEILESKSIDAENQKAAMEAILQVAAQEGERVRGSINEKDHNLDLMSMDKVLFNPISQNHLYSILKN